MAEILLQQHSTASTTPLQLSKDWYKRFLKRHDELRTVFSRQLENKRARAHDVSIISDYFDLYHREKLLKNIKDNNTHNMDEKGFLIGYAAGARIIIPRSSKARFVTHDGNRELVTVIECISATAEQRPPLSSLRARAIS